MPIPSTTPSTTLPLSVAQQQTLKAASRAREAGLISPQQFARMTDGTVSSYDSQQAIMIFDAQVKKGILPGTGLRAIAADLGNAIGAQMVSENAADLKKTQANPNVKAETITDETRKDWNAASLSEIWSTTPGVKSAFVAALTRWGDL